MIIHCLVFEVTGDLGFISLAQTHRNPCRITGIIFFRLEMSYPYLREVENLRQVVSPHTKIGIMRTRVGRKCQSG